MARKLLADGHLKFTILTTRPTNPASPTVTELNGGIDASCLVLTEGFSWTAAASDAIDEDALCATVNAQSPGRGNSNLAFSTWRQFDDDTAEFDTEMDELFEAVKVKGTTLWGYLRANGKAYSEPWAASDEISYGAEFATDTPQMPAVSGYMKYAVPCMAQNAWPFATVGSGA